MAGIFTRKALTDVLNSETTPEEKVDAIYSLYGRAIDDNYVTKAAANAAKQDAVEQAKADALKDVPPVDVKASNEYKALQTEYNAYKVKQEARTSADYAGVKPKFFDAVYDRVDRSEGAKPVKEQLDAMRADFEEFFNPTDDNGKGGQPGKPQFGAGTGGQQPSGEKGASMTELWGYSKKYGLNEQQKGN